MSTTVQRLLTDYHPSSRGSRPSLLARAIETLSVWRQRVRERRALARLDERDWHDFGASSSDVFAELRRPFWRAPPRR